MALPTSPPSSPQRPRALAELSLNSILSSEHSNSSDEELRPDEEQNEEAGSVLGVSIGKEQSRLTSPRTPAVEKTAAINKSGGFFESIPEEYYEGTKEEQVKTLGHTLAASGEVPPSPWRVEQRRTNESRSILKDGFFFGRRRSSSGPSRKASIFSNLPSFGTSSSRVSPKEDQSRGSLARSRAQSIAKEPAESRSTSPSPSPPGEPESENGTDARLRPEERPKLEPLRTRTSQLRRSASESSLAPMRTLSMVSSLGDDSQWEDVHEMVNSRFKALKDSLQDADIKLPSINFSVASFAPTFLRERSDSASKKDVVDPVTRQPYHSTRAAVSDTVGDKAITHPHLHHAMGQLEGDLVILGGYRGSILRSAEPPNRQVWVPVKVGLNLRKVDLEVGIEEDADENATEHIIPDGMLTHIGPVDISRRLFKRLRSCDRARAGKLRVHDYGYDWRLHPHHLSKQLIQFLESLPYNKPGVSKSKRGAIVIAHSLGGLITRHAVNQRPELFKGVVYAGVPKTCVNILGPLRNGDDVLLSSRVLTAQVNFTIRTSFALLPLDGRCFIDKDTQEEYRVDFFDPQTWIDYRLSPCVARPLPPLADPKAGGIAGYMNSLTSALPSFPIRGRKGSGSKTKNLTDPQKATMAAGVVAEPDSLQHGLSGAGADEAVAEGNIDTSTSGEQGRAPQEDQNSSVKTAVTIPKQDAIEYLTRTLATVKKFKQELAFNKTHAAANVYPPVSVIYGKSVPTVFGARVQGRDGIKRADAFDDLAFGSGDGVVLARASMLPDGYTAARGGVVKTDRGHVTMLGDLEAVAKCLNAVIAARKRGVGIGAIDN